MVNNTKDFKNRLKRIRKKDALLKADGYKELRIPWREYFHNPKDWIAKVKGIIKIVFRVGVPNWLKAADCKSVTLETLGVQIPPCP